MLWYLQLFVTKVSVSSKAIQENHHVLVTAGSLGLPTLVREALPLTLIRQCCGQPRLKTGVANLGNWFLSDTHPYIKSLFPSPAIFDELRAMLSKGSDNPRRKSHSGLCQTLSKP